MTPDLGNFERNPTMAVDDIFVGQNGVVSVAPYGTTLPASASTALAPEFESLGEISEEGLTHSFSADKTMLKNWRGEDVRTLITGNSITFSLTFLEDNRQVLELFYGHEATAAAGASSIELGQPLDAPVVMVITLTDGDKDQRFVLPRVEVSDRGDKTFSIGSAGTQLTFAALYDDVAKNQGMLQFAWDISARDGGAAEAAEPAEAKTTAKASK
jgi:hypothetical protein